MTNFIQVATRLLVDIFYPQVKFFFKRLTFKLFPSPRCDIKFVLGWYISLEVKFLTFKKVFWRNGLTGYPLSAKDLDSVKNRRLAPNYGAIELLCQ